MVAVDDDRKPVAVPALRPFSPDERRRHAAAIVRKEMRIEAERRFAALHTDR
jgi:acyl-CoA hydrolase